MMTKLIFADIGQFTDKGKMREINEDSYAIYVPVEGEIEPEDDGGKSAHPWAVQGMLVVSDGLGGHVAGETASKLVTGNFQEFIANAAAKIEEEELKPEISEDQLPKAENNTKADNIEPETDNIETTSKDSNPEE